MVSNKNALALIYMREVKQWIESGKRSVMYVLHDGDTFQVVMDPLYKDAQNDRDSREDKAGSNPL